MAPARCSRYSSRLLRGRLSATLSPCSPRLRPTSLSLRWYVRGLCVHILAWNFNTLEKILLLHLFCGCCMNCVYFTVFPANFCHFPCKFPHAPHIFSSLRWPLSRRACGASSNASRGPKSRRAPLRHGRWRTPFAPPTMWSMQPSSLASSSEPF